MKRIGLLSFLCLPAFALAQTHVESSSFHYLELGLVDAELDIPGPNLDGNGFQFEYSTEVRDHVHLFAGYERLELDDVDGDSARKLLGLGVHYRPLQKLTVFGRAAWTDMDVDLGSGNVGDDGFTIIGGARYLIGDGWEVRGGAEYVDLDAGDSTTVVTVGADFFLTDVVALTLDVDDRDGTTTTMLGFRFYFDNDIRRGQR